MKTSLPQLLLTGFEPFLDVALNPSGELAAALADQEIGGARVCSTILPVAYGRLVSSYAEALARLAPRGPVALLSLGVHREGFFRLESRARPVFESDQPDADGVRGVELQALGEDVLHTSLDVEALAAALRDGGAAETRLSDNAGGYLCERCYYEVLATARRLGVPGFFLHVPPVGLVPVEEQLLPVRAFIAELVKQAKA